LALRTSRNVGDVRESPALDELELLSHAGATLSYTDPYVLRLQHLSFALESVPEADVRDVDCAVIATNHASFRYDEMVHRFPLIVDTRNALRGHHDRSIFRL
jgi:UDP-N-acetyl-D-glucosamine dehydrogenase